MQIVVLASQLQPESNPDAPGVVMTLTGAGIALFLLIFLRWVVGHAITLAHEGGHALMAVLLGGRVKSVTTESDRTGETLATHPDGFGPLDRAVYLGAGYIAPSVFGFAAAEALGHGRPSVVLWATVALLAILLPSTRNPFAFFATITFGFVLVVIAVRGDDMFRSISAVTWAWLLLSGGVFDLVDHFEQGVDFGEMSPNFFPPIFFAVVYTVASLVVMFYAGLVMVGAREPFIG